jgi:hypothetical protein
MARHEKPGPKVAAAVRAHDNAAIHTGALTPTSSRARAGLALAALTAALLAAGAGLLGWSLVGPADDAQALEQIQVGVFGAAFGAIGAFLVARRPGNAIGWLFLVDGFAWALSFVCSTYSVAALYTPERSLPHGQTAVWLATWLTIPGYAIVAGLVFMLFPDGKPVSRRWRPLVVLAALGVPLATASMALTPGPLEDPFERFRNPYGLDPLGDVLGYLGWPLVLGGLAAGLAALVVRLRRARGVERDRIKWVLCAFLLLAALFGAGVAYSGAGPVFTAGFVGVPVATAVGIVRHRLYDIDVIVRRTLVYGVATAALAGLYFGIVLALQEVFSSFAGGSDLAIAVSTLAVAALFGPARRRVQSAVDRRFYRRGYDAQRTLEAFSARLRDEIDLDALRGELGRVVDDTMQPAHVTLWLRGGR